LNLRYQLTILTTDNENVGAKCDLKTAMIVEERQTIGWTKITPLGKEKVRQITCNIPKDNRDGNSQEGKCDDIVIGSGEISDPSTYKAFHIKILRDQQLYRVETLKMTA